MTNDQAKYYSGITSIRVNRKNAYELKGKFFDDLHKNAFSGTNGEDAVEHIEYFLKIVGPTDLPNVNQDKLRVVVFPISLVRDAWRWVDGIMITLSFYHQLHENRKGFEGDEKLERGNKNKNKMVTFTQNKMRSNNPRNGFPAQSIRSSNAIALDSPYLLVLITEMPQSRQH
nr:hypothetical protein [Tanacetum cinerariifolium]